MGKVSVFIASHGCEYAHQIFYKTSTEEDTNFILLTTSKYPETTKDFLGYGPLLQRYIAKEGSHTRIIKRPSKSWQKETEMQFQIYSYK